jgi:hypothetical protein
MYQPSRTHHTGCHIQRVPGHRENGHVACSFVASGPVADILRVHEVTFALERLTGMQAPASTS